MQMSTFLSFYVIPLFPFLFSVFLFKWLTNKTEKNLPPSPPKLPIIGNLHQLGLNPQLSLQSFAKKHGPIMLLQLGSKPTLVVSSADAAKEILKSHDSVFSTRPISSTFSKIFYNGKDVAFAPYGEYWRRMKSICVLKLLSTNKVQSFRRIREEEVDLWVEKIKQLSYSNYAILNLNELFVSLNNDIFCRIVLGRKYSNVMGEEGDGEENKVKVILGSVIELLGAFSVGDHVPWLSWVDHITGLKSRCKKLTKKIDAFLEEVVKDHILKADEKKQKGDDGASQDFVDILLETQKQSIPSCTIDTVGIKAITFDMFIAGVDTTYTVTEWAMSQLLKHPKAMASLRDEVREIGKGKSSINENDLEKMQYLKAVMKETMRLTGPFPLLVPRESREDVKVMGYDIAAGTQVFTNVWAIGRDPSLWDKPEEFLPERFLNSPIDYKGLHFELTPFGGGRRGCPGIGFAMIINELIVANLVHNFEFSLPDGKKLEDLDMTSIYGITVHRKYPLLVSVTPHHTH